VHSDYDKSQGSVVAHLQCSGLFSCHFSMYISLSLVVNIFFIGEHLAKLQAKRLIVSCALFAWQCPG